MRVFALVAAFAVVALSDGAAQFKTPDQIRPTGLLVGHRVEEYFGDKYTATPLETFVFFRGEPVTYRISVLNVGALESALVIDSTDAQRLFTVSGFKAPPIPPEKITLERPASNDRFLDEVDIDVTLRVSSPIKTWPGGGASAISLDRETRLAPQEGLDWIVNLPTDFEPGLYRVIVKLNGFERGGRSLRGFAHFRFEVRPSTPDAQPELLRRQATRLWVKEEFGRAREAVAELLKVHPNSAEAYGILGMIADREGKGAEAVTHRTRATEIIQARRDELLIRYARNSLR